MLRQLSLFASLLFLGCFATAVAADSSDESILTIGSKAPPLAIEHWYSGKKPNDAGTVSFEKGKIYVVEFWATWCPPCIASMPHLAELQEKYAGKGVRIISVSDEDEEIVRKFLKQEAPGSSGVTFKKLTSAYTLTSDPDMSVSKDYMEAAGQGNIPTAFIVGRGGLVEWIGHPGEMDEPLEEIVAGKWDREAFGKEFRLNQQASGDMMLLQRTLQAGKFDDGLKLIQRFKEKYGSKPDVVAQLEELRPSVVLMSGDDSKIRVMLQELLDNRAEPRMLDGLTWGVYETHASRKTLEKETLALALKVSQSALKRLGKNDNNEKASVLDTSAHLQSALGDDKAALKLQERAVELADEKVKADFEKFLEELKQRLKAKK